MIDYLRWMHKIEPDVRERSAMNRAMGRQRRVPCRRWPWVPAELSPMLKKVPWMWEGGRSQPPAPSLL